MMAVCMYHSLRMSYRFMKYFSNGLRFMYCKLLIIFGLFNKLNECTKVKITKKYKY